MVCAICVSPDDPIWFTITVALPRGVQVVAVFVCIETGTVTSVVVFVWKRLFVCVTVGVSPPPEFGLGCKSGLLSGSSSIYTSAPGTGSPRFLAPPDHMRPMGYTRMLPLGSCWTKCVVLGNTSEFCTFARAVEKYLNVILPLLLPDANGGVL